MEKGEDNQDGLDQVSSRNDEPTTANLVASIDPAEFEGLTLYEKKCVLINHEIDSNGMGKYQWYIWFLCGFGYLLDLLWAQAFGLVLSPLEQELGFPPDQSGNISVAFSSGLTAGAFVWGALVDIIGRRWAFNFTCLFAGAFGLALGGCNSYTAFLVVTAFNGFGVGGNIPIDTTICLEFIPQSKRFLLALLSIFQPLGVTITVAIAYGFIPRYSCEPNFTADNPLPSCNQADPGEPCCTRDSNMGWRHTLFTLGAISLGIFGLRFFMFNFQESPKYLVYRGQDDKAIAVLEHIAKVNKRPCGVTKADFEALTGEEDSQTSATELIGAGAAQKKAPLKDQVMIELARYRLLFNGWQMAYLTILVWLTYIMDFWGFTLAGTFLPRIVALKNSQLNLSLEYTYRTYFAIYTPGLVGVVLGSMMYAIPTFGRKIAMTVSSGLMGVSIFIFSVVNGQASNIGLNFMEYFFQSMFNAVLYGWTPEVFPAPIRGTACGVASFWGRLFGIIAPLTAQQLLPSTRDAEVSDYQKVLYLAGGITLGCVLTTAILPNHVLGKQSM
ncbi:MFS general substrate transporter [Hortaea werneckii]|nr:MFS general substrate transporter [Hortaea werneckii]KAI7060193.1 MFS general substrate transporter [Hortaea werneckii]KAI7118819.1 MFS general substrate transporter [Hortaea werneckii]